MDYTKENIAFKIRKLVRYFRLYGFERTIAKVKGQYHMGRVFNKYSNIYRNVDRGYIALVGCGNYSFSTLAHYAKEYSKNSLRCCFDVNKNRSISLQQEYNLFYVASRYDEIVSDKSVKKVFIASNHASHAEYAIEAIMAGKDVHIEKPHVVSYDQLRRLRDAMMIKPGVKVFLGFNRPRSPLFRQMKSLLDKESGPLMINWFVAGHEIPDDHWYFDEKEGGRVLGNLCHWTDLTLHMVGLENAFPCKVIPSCPKDAKSDFVFSVIFADRSCATITFSAKGHTFEGVREVLNVHKGSVIGNITDFQKLTADVNEKKIKKTLFYRNHGHKENIQHTLKSTDGENINYVVLTAKLFLGFKEALDTGKEVVVDSDLSF